MLLPKSRLGELCWRESSFVLRSVGNLQHRSWVPLLVGSMLYSIGKFSTRISSEALQSNFTTQRKQIKLVTFEAQRAEGKTGKPNARPGLSEPMYTCARWTWFTQGHHTGTYCWSRRSTTQRASPLLNPELSGTSGRHKEYPYTYTVYFYLFRS